MCAGAGLATLALIKVSVLVVCILYIHCSIPMQTLQPLNSTNINSVFHECCTVYSATEEFQRSDRIYNVDADIDHDFYSP